MKKKKDFDRVEMKWGIQRKIREECAGIPKEEARRIEWEKIAERPGSIRLPHTGATMFIGDGTMGHRRIEK